MNLKKKAISLFAAASLAMTMGAPLVSAAEGNSVDGEVGVYETGTFNYNLWGSHAPDFGTVGLKTTTGDQVLPQKRQQVDYHELRTTSPGWTIQLTATEFEANDGSGHSISSEYLAVSPGTPRVGAAFACYKSTAVENPDNPFAKPVVPASGKFTLDSAVEILTADAGRGCGTFYQDLMWEMTVPQGTYTGGNNTPVTYVSNITASTVADVGEGEQDGN